MNTANRLASYQAVSSQLALLSDQSLLENLKASSSITVGIGGTKGILQVADRPVFVKKIPLSDLERQAENHLSTANFFELPLYYQYGLSSDGFGGWRELAAQQLTSDWVLAGDCAAFPLLYHWRVLPMPSQKLQLPQGLKDLERSVKYWGGSSAIRARLLAKQEASAELVLFLEYFPETLDKWFGIELQKSEAATEKACAWLPSALLSVASFMQARGLLHFDAHLNNILTDGSSLYFCDFGLALASSFMLSKEEELFFERHADYDRCLLMMSLVHRVLAAQHGTKDRNLILQEYSVGEGTPLSSPALTKLVRQYAPLAVLLKNFNQKLMLESKDTAYPAVELAQACKDAGLALF